MSQVSAQSEHSQRSSQRSTLSRSTLSRRRSSFLLELGRELVEVPVQHEYVYGGSKAELAAKSSSQAVVAARPSQLEALAEKGESGEVEGVNLLPEEEPDHRTGEAMPGGSAWASLVLRFGQCVSAS